MDEVPTRTPDFVVSLSGAFDSRITENLSPALRAARVEIRCPSKACARAGNLCGGEPDAWCARLPSNPPPHTYCIRVRIIHPFPRQRGNASLAAIWKSAFPTRSVLLTIDY